MPRHLFYLRTRMLFGLFRSANLLILSIAQLLVSIFLAGPLSGAIHRLCEYKLWALILACGFVAAGGYVINDYYDIKIDLINKPTRVVIDRKLRRRKAILIHAILSILGISMGFLVGNWAGLVCLITVFLLWLYSNALKRSFLIGNILVSLLSAVGLVLPAFYFDALGPLIWLFVGYAFVVSMIREIIKDIEDIRGDARYGCQTVPIVLGLHNAKYIVGFLSVLLIILLFFPPIFVPLTFRIYALFMQCWMVFFLIRLHRADRRKHFANLSLMSKLIMLLGILAMVFFSY